MDKFASMAVFVRVADRGSFVGAANELGISAAMVGKHIRALEADLGVDLIARTTRRQTLTESGRAYYERCRAILREVAETEAEIGHSGRSLRGSLRITMPVVLGRHCVAPLLLELVSEWPHVQLELHFSDDIVDLQDFDLAIRSLPASDLRMPGEAGLATRLVGRHAMIVCVSPTYVAKHGRPQTRNELAHHQLLPFGRRGRSQPWSFGGPNGIVERHEAGGRVVMDDLEALADAAVAGWGAVFLPSWLAKPLIAEGRLIDLSLDAPGLNYNNFAVWHDGIMPAKVRKTIDRLVERVPRLM